MTKLPLCSARCMGRVLELAGFIFIKASGGHFKYRHPDGRWTIVPQHGSKDLARPLIRGILSQCRLIIVQYLELLELA